MIRSKWRISRWRCWIKHFNMRRAMWACVQASNWRKSFERKWKTHKRDSTSEFRIHKNNFCMIFFFVFNHHYLFQSLNNSREIFACTWTFEKNFLIFLNDLWVCVRIFCLRFLTVVKWLPNFFTVAAHLSLMLRKQKILNNARGKNSGRIKSDQLKSVFTILTTNRCSLCRSLGFDNASLIKN